jgi:phosphoenolpyruvate phosphomutase
MSSKFSKFKELLYSQQLEILLEAHNGLSAKIVEESGFKGIWASGLTISASQGVRDNNEASWTQVLEVAEFMSDATSIPILIDADTGYGNFNNARRLVRKLEQRDIAAVCIEDKIFPKANSLSCDSRHLLAEVNEFSGKIRAVKDTQTDPDFCVVARIESFVVGCGLAEALRRAEAYYRAGVDGILIHSKNTEADEVLSFMREWRNTCPVIIVPTTYYKTPIEVFEKPGSSMVIWANQLFRASINAMRETAKKINLTRSAISVEHQIASIKDIFCLQNLSELIDAEKRYLLDNVQERSNFGKDQLGTTSTTRPVDARVAKIA